MTEPLVTLTKTFQNKSEQFILETGDLPQVYCPNIRTKLAVTKVKLVFVDDLYQNTTFTGFSVNSSGGLGPMREAPYPSTLTLPDWLVPFTDITTVRNMALSPSMVQATD